MVLESTQILSTVSQLRGFWGPYRMTHKHHPCVKWTAEHPANWAWLIRHSVVLYEEYTSRYGKHHKCAEHIDKLEEMSPLIWEDTAFEDNLNYWAEHKPFVQCMPDKYKGPSAVEAYRAYYNGEKSRFAKWAHSEKPSWITF